MRLRHQSELREPQVERGQFDLEFYKSYNYEESKHFKINHYPSERKPDYVRWVYKDIDVYSPAQYKTLSRYTKVPILKEKGKQYHATNRIRFVFSSPSDIYYVVTNMTVNRLDLISLKMYNSPIYWWVIAEANFIFDPFNEVYLGRKLRIPPLDSALERYVM